VAVYHLDEATVERLARATHERHAEEGPHPHAPIPWEELPDDIRDINRDQIRDIPAKLATLGLELQYLAAGASPLEFPDEQSVESLARLEHERWVRFRRARGWEFARQTSGDTLRHSSLVPYEQLSDSEAEKDRVVVWRIPWLLAQAGLGVCPASDSGED